LFRFFTQADADIAGGYHERYIPAFPHPELRMMLGAFATAEANHMHSYSLLLDTIGMPETEYQAFQQFDEMKAKHEFLFAQRNTGDPVRDLALDIAIFSAFGEGMQLFSTFAILLSFKERGLMKGMSTIIEWSINDESLHVESMIRLFRTLVEENPHIWTDEFKRDIYETCRQMVALEDLFIDLAFSGGAVSGITAEETKQYIRYIADRRLLQLGLKANYGQKDQPFDWLEWMLNAKTHTNFFEGRETGYSKSGISGWSTAWDWLQSESDAKAPLLIVLKAGCPYCVLVKAEFDSRRIAYTELDLSDDALRQKFYDQTGTSSVPQVFRPLSENDSSQQYGERIGGWTEVAKVLDSLT
jgi:ribonucleoside-diphosphate reductase beta chain